VNCTKAGTLYTRVQGMGWESAAKPISSWISVLNASDVPGTKRWHPIHVPTGGIPASSDTLAE